MFRQFALHLGEVAFRRRKIGVDRIEPFNRQKLSGVGRHHVAVIHQPVSRAAIDRRSDRGVVQIQARGFHRRFILPYLRFAHIHRVFSRVVILPRDGPGFN